MEMNIGANIKRLRNLKKITQEQLSIAMNVTCAAVSKWERGETYPDITLLQPLAYYFGVSLDELMGYDQVKIQMAIDDVVNLYRKNINTNRSLARQIITEAHKQYPNDFLIMHYYMWNIAGEADNDPRILISHKEEFIDICDKIINGCTVENIRLNAWSMKAKILHAEGKIEEALEVFQTNLASWHHTNGQKSEMLFGENTDEYYYWLRRNMYELIAFSGYKLGSVIFYDKETDLASKVEKSIRYGKLMLKTLDETGDIFFAGLALAFLGRICHQLTFNGGSDDDIIRILDMNLYAAKKIARAIKNDNAVHQAYFADNVAIETNDYLGWIVDNLFSTKGGRPSELLKNPNFKTVLDKYR